MKTTFHAFFLCALTALFAASAGWAADRTLSVDNSNGSYYINMPATGNDKLVISEADIIAGSLTFKVYDDGGSSDAYSNDALGFLEIDVPEGYRLSVSGSLVVRPYQQDYLTIYDGTIYGATVINQLGRDNWQTDYTLKPFISSSETIVINFRSDNDGRYAGLDLTISVYDPDNYFTVGLASTTGGSVTASSTESKALSPVILTINPDEGYALSGLAVEYAGNNRIEPEVSWYTSEVTFDMPAANVSVVPTFTDDVSDLYVKLEQYKTKKVPVPAGINSFKVYDDGGADGNPNSSVNEYIEIVAPEGYVIRVTGTMSSRGTLSFYDGENTSAPLILDVSSGYSANAITVAATSTGRSMAFSFYSGSYCANCSGFDLTVTLEDASIAHAVSAPVLDGVSSEGAGDYTVGQEVSMTFTPENANLRYVSVDVRNRDNLSLAATTLTDENGVTTVTFTMPYSDVTVSPTFATVRSVNILSAPFGSMTSDVPTAVVDATVTLTAIPDDGAELVNVVVVGEDDGIPVDVSRNGNTITFTMPDQSVTVTPVFANPSVVTFDENGCLTNGTYFHLVCDGSECTLSQVPVANPDEGETDFRCWYLNTSPEQGNGEKGVVDQIIEHIEQESSGLTLKLGSPINLGGYDSENSKCVMANFQPIPLSMEDFGSEFDGQNYTVSGFCYESTTNTSGGFVTGATSVQDVTFDGARVVVNNAERGSIVGVVAAEMRSEEANSISNVRVVNSYVAGTQAGALVGRITGNATVSNSSAIDTKVYGLKISEQGVRVSAIGGLVGDAASSVSFLRDTVMATVAGASVVANDETYGGTGESYRGGLVGYTSGWEAAITVTNCHVSGLSVSGSINSNVGAVAGQVSTFDLLNTKLENISVSGMNAGGAVGQVTGDSPVVTMMTDTIAGTSTITGTANAGGLVGYADVYTSSMNLGFSYLTIAASVSGGNSVGGIVGYVDISGEVASTVTVEQVSVAGSVGATVEGMTADVGVGGLFGKASMVTMSASTLTVSKTSFSGNVNFANSGEEGTLYMGSLIGFANVENLTLYGNYASGSIAYSGVTGGNVGYLCGFVDVTNYTPMIFGNYYYGEDEVETGFGNMAVATWTAGADSYLANARNATGSLTASEGFGFHLYDINYGETSGDAIDMFAANVSETAFTRVRNGVVSENDMQSGVFAALLNQIPSRSVALNTFIWIGQDGQFPRVAMPNEKASYLLPLAIMDVSNFSVGQKEAVGLYAIYEGVDLSGSSPAVSTAYEGFAGYTDADGHPNKMFVDSLQAVIQILESSGYAPYLTGEGLQTTMITASTVFNDGVEFIGVKTDKALNTYNVVYQACTGEAAITCSEFDPGTLYLFMSPLVTEITNGEESYTTLIPHRIAKNDGTSNSWVIRYVTTEDEEIDTDYRGSFGTFQDAIAHMPTTAEIKTIIVGFYDVDEVPTVAVMNPSAANFELEAYAYASGTEGEKDLIYTKAVTASDNQVGMAYGSSFAAKNFASRVGYTYESYAVSFTVSNPDDGRCMDGITSVGTVETENKFFAPWEELAATQGDCTSKTWIVNNLGQGDTVSLEQVEYARSNVGDFTKWSEEITVLPKYNANPYTIVFNFDGNGEDDVEGVFVDDSYADIENPLTLESEIKSFPVMYGGNSLLAGWTLDENRGNCYVGNDNCIMEVEIDYGGFLFTELTPELITAAGDARTIQLYPVWENVSGMDDYTIEVSDCLRDNYDGCYEVPIQISLSQTRTLGGNPVVFSSDLSLNYGAKINVMNGNQFTFDADVRTTPGFKVTSVSADGYDASTGTLVLSGDVNFNVDYSLLKYNVKFNLDDAGSDIYLGRGTTSSMVMSYENNESVFPPIYSKPTYGDDFVFSKYYTDNVFYGKYNWGVKNDGAYVGSSSVFNSGLVGLFDGTDYYTPAANEGGNASITLYADYVEPAPESGSSTTLTAQRINVCVQVNEDGCVDGDGSEFHGSVVLSQSYDNDAENVHWNFEHASEYVVHQQQYYGEDEADYARHVIYIPSHNDTLTFNVSVRPDPGYTMAITNFTYENHFDYTPETNADPVVWGYTAADATLNIQPSAMKEMIFEVSYTQLGYNVAYSRPSPESGLFVGNKIEDGAFKMDWLEGMDGLTAETAHAPALYNGDGCRVGWKVSGREVEVRETTDILSELPYMAVADDNLENPVVNTLEIDAEHTVPSECDGTYQLTLDVEGEGEVYFIQKIGAVPAEDGDPEQTIIKHVFSRADDDSPLTLTVPKVLDKNGTETGVKLIVVAVAADGNVLGSLSYDRVSNGNQDLVMVQDSTELNVMGNQNWHVTFEQFKPVYVTYDLALGEEDSSKVWIPTDAVLSGALQIGADGSEALMWEPYRVDKCFVGWSTYNPNGASPRPEVLPIYTLVSTDNIGDFSDDIASPTPLYALWTDYGNGCNAPHLFNTFTVAYYGDLTESEEDAARWRDTLVVTQRLGNAVFTHMEVGNSIKGEYNGQFSDDWMIAYNPNGYDVELSILPCIGFEVDADDPDVKVVEDMDGEQMEYVTATDGVFRIGTASGGRNYNVGVKTSKIQYHFATVANGGDAAVLYGEHWDAGGTYVYGDSLPARFAFRSDACLSEMTGWSFDPDWENSPNNGAYFWVDEDFLTARAQRIAAGLEADVLYLPWNESDPDCRMGMLNLTLDPEISDIASITLYQEVNGVEVESITIGAMGVQIPQGPMGYDGGHTTYVGDNIYFTRAEVKVKPGATLDENYTISYVNESDADQTVHSMPTVAGGAETLFDDNIVFSVQGLTRNDYAVAYHENAGDENVFYGEYWASTATLNVGDGLTTSLYRTDACLAGWSFDASSGDAFVYHTIDADFISELADREIEGNIDLYAVWSTNGAACSNSIQNVDVSLSEALVGKATVELQQEVEGESKVVATVGAEGISIPKMSIRAVDIDGHTVYIGENGYFSGLRVIPAAGYELDATVNPSFVVGDADEVEVTGDQGPWTMTDNTVISGAVSLVGYTVAFDVNGGNANVFYPSNWPENPSSVPYDLSMDEDARLFPKAYRTDKCLVGYGFSKDASKAESFTEFSTDFVVAYDSVVASGVESPVVYGVWNECETPQTLYTVTLKEPVEGTLVLSQFGNTYDVPSAGFSVPAATPAIEFGVSFIVKEGYEFDDNGVFNVVDGDGAVIEVLEDNMLVVDDDKIVDAPAAGKPYTFAFDVNVIDGVNVFYGDAWKASENYALATEDVSFPTAVYRVGACLEGWTIGATSTTAYTHYNADFVAAVENANRAGITVSTLYAKWGDCDPEQSVVTVANANPAAGTFTLSRTVDDVQMDYVVDATALQIPADEAMAFHVSFAPDIAYTYDETVGISAVDESDASVEITDEGFVTVAASMTLSAGVIADAYEFALDENAGGANVFYAGDLVTSFSAAITDDEDARTLPTNIYRADACLVGWNFSATATTGFQLLDEQFVAAYKTAAANSSEAPETLYAIWDASCQQTVYTVTSADSAKGTLTLTQADGRSFDVNSSLQVPAVQGGLAFLAEFTVGLGYSYDETQGVQLYDSQDEELVGTYEDGEIVVGQSVVVKAKALTPITYELSYLENAGDVPVYYGNAWRAGNYRTLFTLDDTGALPMDLYRTDSCLVGWAHSTEEGAETFVQFSRELLIAGENGAAVLYAIWGACDTENNASVSQVTSAAGTMVLKQTDADGGWLSEVFIEGEAVTLPLGNGDVSFDVSFVEGDGFVLDPDGYYYTVDATGNNVAALVGNKLELAGNTILRAPIISDTYEVVFNVNAGDATVFYGEDWVEGATYYVTENAQDFPKGVYRVGSCLAGWALSANSGTAYSQFDLAFMKVVESAKNSGLPYGTLYAVWGDCDPEQTVVTVANANPAAGTFTLSREVSSTSVEYVVGETALQVPADEPLEFVVSYAVNRGYTYDAAEGISAVDAADDPVEIVGDMLNVATSLTLSATVSADAYTFALAENGSSANVFYTGSLQTTFSASVTDDASAKAFPMNLYRADACLVGWNFSETATEGFTQLDEDFIAAYEAATEAGDDAPETLYAVWNTGCSQTVYTVTSSDKGLGTLSLAQADGRTFEVGDGLLVPATAEGIVLTAAFVPATGFAYNDEAGFNAFSSMGNDLGLLEDATVSVRQSMSIKANGLAASEYTITFNMNAGDATVYYGTPANGASPEYTYSLSNATAFPMDFYRTDACLTGWRTTAEAVDDEVVFTGFDAEFVAAVASDDNYTGTLYAVWGECSETNNVTVANAAPATGTLKLEQRDASGTALNSTVVAGDAVTLPLGNGELKFSLGFTAAAGYTFDATGYYYTVNANNENQSVLPTASLTLAGNTILRAPVSADAFTITFNANAGDATVYYGSPEKGASPEYVYSLVNAATFPMDFYRTDACLVGWRTAAEAVDGETVFSEFNAEFVAAIAEDDNFTGTLYGVWGECAEANNVTVAQVAPAMGTLTLEQLDASGVALNSTVVAGDAVTLPLGNGELKFSLSFTAATGYTFATNGVFYTVDAEGNNLAAIANKTLALAGNTIVKAPVSADAFTITFNANAGGATVYYGAPEMGSAPSYSYTLAESATFPANFYRTDACLVGWRTTAEAVDGETVFSEFNAEFVTAIASDDNFDGTLYGVWGECSEANNVTVAQAAPETGTLTLEQLGMSGAVLNSTVVAGDAVTLPLGNGELKFSLSFTAATGYTFATNGVFYTVDAEGNNVAPIANGVLTLNANTIVKAPVSANTYTITFNANAGESTVYYGAPEMGATPSYSYTLAEPATFPADFYRTDACLVGWRTTAESADDESVFSTFNAEFVAAIAEDANFTGTLYGVWGECSEANTATIAQAAPEMGTLTLEQRDLSGAVLNSTVVGEDVVTLPLGNGELKFTIAYAAAEGYTAETNGVFYAVSADGSNIAPIMNNTLAFTGSMVVKVPASADTYTITFNANAGGATVYYGSPEKGASPEYAYSLANIAVFPTGFYRTDACLTGWAVSTDADAAVFTQFDAEFVAAISDNANFTGRLYAVWGECSEANNVTVAQSNSAMGTLTLEQRDASGTLLNSTVVASDAATLPLGGGELQFTLKYDAASGYTYAENGMFYRVDEEGNNLAAIANSTLSLRGNTIVKAPVSADAFTIVFNTNAGNATVYYGSPEKGASPEYVYSLVNTAAFPTDFYRTDACLTGWTISTDAGADVFTQFDAEFVAAISDNDDFTGTLYGVWGECAEANNATVALFVPESGTLTLEQRDGSGNLLNSTVVAGDATTLPLGGGELQFMLKFSAATGYSYASNGVFYMVDAEGNNLAAIANNTLAFRGNTIVKAPVSAESYRFAFNVNVEDSEMFFGTAWVASGNYDMFMAEADRKLPTAVYRVGYKLVGWSLSPMEDDMLAVQELPDGSSGYVGVYDTFDESLIESLAQASETTLYGVWVSDQNQAVYTVSLFDSNVGTVTLSQNVDGYSTQFSLGADPIRVPAVDGGILFDASATLKEGYFAYGNNLYLVTSEGTRLGTLAGGLLMVNEDRIIDIPVESDGIQFVFSENTGDRVFYEDGWQSKGFFAFEGETEFPKGLLRTGGILQGWALSRTSSKYYTRYDADFVNDVRSTRALGLPTDTLFAVWLEYGTFDNVTVTAGNEKNGTFYISQTLNGLETEPIEVTSAGVEIPNSSKLTFNVKLDLNAGYYLSDEDALHNQTIDGEVLERSANGGTMHLGASNSVLAADVAATLYNFVFDVNATGTNVFYGDSWSSHGENSLDEDISELPHGIYRSDARLVGWSLSPSATEGVFNMTSEFVRTIRNNTNVTTLYAVWEPAQVETYKVTFANTNVGSLVLTQDVEDSTVSFNVPVAGLAVPVVEEGLHFKAAYTLNAGYAGSTDSLYRIDDLGEIIGNLSSGELTVDQDVTLAIPTSGESYKIVFNVNRENEVLFHGNDWIDSRTYMMTADSSSFPLPAYLYTADACMVGWSLSEQDSDKLYSTFSSELVEDLRSIEPVDSAYTLYAIWGDGSACDVAYNRVSLQSVNGTIRLVEAATATSENPVEHVFAGDNTIILPKVMSGNMLHVVSLPDSSYVLDSLVTIRLGGDEHLATFEGGSLPFDLSEASLVAYFGKSNRSAIAFVDTVFAKTGNAVQFKFTTSEFEVTRGVSARIILETAAGEVIAKETLSDSIVPPYKGVWEKFPLAADKYVLTAILSDGTDSVEYMREFEVTAEIAAVYADGWQMISIGNLDKDAMIWDDDPKFFWWDESSAFGDFWQYKELDRNDDIDPTRGYWSSSLEGRPLVLKPDPGQEIETVMWNLDSINSGWNLVANPVGFALDVYGDHPSENTESTEESRITFWRWNADIADYEEAVILNPYEAVWAKVSSSTEWSVPVRPQYLTADSTEEAEGITKSLNKSAKLAKANGTGDWRLQAVLSDAKGHRDSWNVLGVSRRPFATDEPPEGMGDHVKLSVVEGTRALAKSVKAPADEQEWTLSLNASSDRIGELSFKGVADLNAYGLNVYVTVDGRTVEMRDDTPLRIALKSSATQAVVRVAPSAKVVAGAQINGLRALQSGNSLNVTFDASEELGGHRTVVDLLTMDGRVVASRSLPAVNGANHVNLDAPKPGLYMLRVRAGSQMKAGRIMVK